MSKNRPGRWDSRRFRSGVSVVVSVCHVSIFGRTSRSSDVSKLLVTVILADAEVICGPPGETDAV